MTTQPPASVVDVTAQSFQSEVLERSTQVPVLIDFWATWCGPCRTLGPILEKLCTEMAGAFVLAKIDIDQNPELAEAFRIQSVPAVILVIDGRPVDGFMGAQPEPQIREFLAPHLAGVPDPLSEALALEQSGDRAGAISSLQQVLAAAEAAAANSDGGAELVAAMGDALGLARAELARMLLDDDQEQAARDQLAKLRPEDLEGDTAKSVKARLENVPSDTDLSELEAAVQAAPDDLARQLELGKAWVGAQRVEDGLEKLLDVAKLDIAFDEGAPRKALLEMFDLLGPENPHTIEFQQRLSILLCP